MDPVAFVGAVCLDIVLSVPHYPREDAEVRISGVRKATGGNATNSAAVHSNLVRALGTKVQPSDGGPPSPPSSFLIAATTDPDADADGRWVRDALVARNVGVEGLVPVAPSGLPTSYIALSPSSRTILHSRTIRELAAADMDEALARVAERAGGGLGWIHFEGRSVPSTRAFLRHLRAVGMPDAVLSVEIEKQRGEGADDVEGLLGEADVVFLSREYATTALGLTTPEAAVEYVAQKLAADGAGTGGSAATATTAPGRPSLPLVVVTWGADGAVAGIPRQTATGAAYTVVRASSHAPSTGAVVDTIGAGDSFVAAFVAFPAVCGGEEGEAWREVVSGGGGGGSAKAGDLLARWLRFACVVAGEKCGQEGLDLAEGAVGAAARALSGL
jgi:ketohexokinase